MNYQDDNRGKIQCRTRAKQIIDFSGLRYNNITPTDIDGYIEYHDNGFMLFEFKLDGADLPRGQETALTRLVDSLYAAHKNAALFVCKHNVSDPEQDIIAAESTVDSIYFKGRWNGGQNKNLKTWTDRFMKWLKDEEQLLQ